MKGGQVETHIDGGQACSGVRDSRSQGSGGAVLGQEKGFWARPRKCKVVAPTRDVNLGSST